jgi:ABC-type dipeptide/oligopeptide/nickel transport system permease subunit
VSDDRLPQEPSVAIDLSKRKRASAHDLRESLYDARRAAMPYVTMTRIALSTLARDRLARAGTLVLACLTMVAIFADLMASDLPLACRWHGALYVLPAVTQPAELAEEDVAQMRSEASPGDWFVAPLVAHGPLSAPGETGELLPPLSAGHPMGTDEIGRDVFARIVHGARTALVHGLAASLVLVLIGVTLGGLAGFVGGTLDALVSRAVEALTAIPVLVLTLVVVATVPHPTTATVLWTIALTRWTELARLVRAEVLLALGTDYVTAARALGASAPRVLWRHVMPNAVGPALVAAAFGVASVVLLEAAVDFLHVGAPDTLASWGEAMGEARGHPGAWWLVAFPGAALLATLGALNLVGDAARDAMDPRLRGVMGDATVRE